jgi:hypothetical protein
MATLRTTFGRLFPDRRGQEPFTTPPLLPADLFAFCAHVLEASGAYHHIAPAVEVADDGQRRINITRAMRTRACRTGRIWRKTSAGLGKLPEVPPVVTALWNSLQTHARAEVFESLDPDDPAPEWWTTTLELMMIADEACRDLGFDGDHPFFKPIALGLAEYDVLTGADFRQIQRAPHTLSTAARTMLCVQAKSLTPSVGCTLRSLTHHLALLPGQGQARARWISSPFANQDDAFLGELGLLLVPYPYKVVNGAFHETGRHRDGRWGWFDVRQLWLPQTRDGRRQFVQFVGNLVQKAREVGQRVDGVVLPELALDYRLFDTLAQELAQDAGIDFLISGISSDRSKRHGNFVAIAPFFLIGKDRSSLGGLQRMFLIREKHHRWKLTEAQINDYNLAMELDPSLKWWEALTLLGRSMDVLVYREATTLTTLICEDLARVDPCQALLRSVGPNLVIALLMDGPQLQSRWPARYATVLAEDPGSSVLSFTSFGLIARQNEHGRFGQHSAVGLWKDEATGARTLELPRDADALHLRLVATPKREFSLDGRHDGGSSHRWEFQSVKGVASEPAFRLPWILAGDGSLKS